MKLCIDSGNTRLKWALHEAGKWVRAGVLPHAELKRLRQVLPKQGVSDGVIGCNVAGAAKGKQIEAALSMPVRWVSAERRRCGVTNAYQDEARLGADRWAALIGAHALCPQTALVVLAGTATTIDLLNADGVHQGGLILPGLTMMLESLATGTAGLPASRGNYQAQPTNTEDALASGAIHATLGAIQRMYAQLPPGAICLLSGGAAEFLHPHLEMPIQCIDNLVLEGLACIAAG